MNRPTVLLVSLISASTSVLAYEEPTHEIFSEHAVNNSVLGTNADFAKNLGFESPDQKFPDSQNTPGTIKDLLKFGSRHEDRIFPEGIRSRHHFFDPYHDRPLTVPLIGTIGVRSADYILEDRGDVSNQEFSYADAKKYFQEALSLPTKTEREKKWGVMFQSLGHVIHHIQDMAQPQHVRNDAHLPGKDPSFYESYTRVNPENWSGFPSSAAVTIGTARRFWTSPDQKGLADFTNRNFVSKDSNFTIRNEELAENSVYPRPDPGAQTTVSLEDLAVSDAERTKARALCDRLKSDPRLVLPPGAKCELDFIESTVELGRVVGSAINKRAASLSLFDQYLRDLNTTIVVDDVNGSQVIVDRLPVLNRYNFDAAYPFLVPSAVAYSAGLINHFFRGRMELESAEAENGQIRIEIKNASESGNAFGPGSFTMYYDSYDGTRKPLSLDAGAEIGAGQFLPGGTHVLLVAPPEDMDLKTESPFVLVYQGKIGAEQAVSGLVLDAPDAYQGFFFDVSASDISDGVQGPRLIYQMDGQWKLHPQGNLPAGGNVDWKGHYVNGKPTRILTWAGSSRYGTGGFFTSISRGGKLFALAPLPVIGAALQKDADGKEWLIAICEGADKDVVFKRPAKRSNSAALYDPDLTPEGWKKIGEFSNPTGLSTFRRPWLFNGDGTEAQTMRERKRDSSFGRKPLTRLKMTTNGMSASMADLGNTQVIQSTNSSFSSCGSGLPVHNTSSETTTGESVIAVDYIDATEVLARVSVESSYVGTENGFVENVGFSATVASDRQTKWTLEFGPISYELVNETETYDATESESSTSFTEQIASERAFVSMDLRTGMLIARRGHFEAISQSTSSQSWTTDSTSYHKYLIKAANGVNESTDQVDVTNKSESWGPWNEDECITHTCHCAGDNSDEAHVSHGESEILASPDTVSSLGIPGGVYGVSAGFDRAGNFFVSLQYGDTTTNTSRHFNFLSGGDSVTLTGINPAKPGFRSIGPK